MARAHYLRGQLLLHRGDVDGAMESLQVAHVFEPDEPTIITMNLIQTHKDQSGSGRPRILFTLTDDGLGILESSRPAAE